MNIQKLLGAALIGVFFQTAFAEGLADRRSEAGISTNQGIYHPHSQHQMNTNPHDVRGYQGDSHAEKMRLKQEDASVLDHIHEVMGAPAAGHPHNMHKHYHKGVDIPAKYKTAHERKKFMFDNNSPEGF